MGVIGEPGKVDLLIRDRLAVATPAGADALKAAYARLRGTIDPARTIANINLEVLGRSDDTEGPTPRHINVTGYDYTDIAAILVKARDMI